MSTTRSRKPTPTIVLTEVGMAAALSWVLGMIRLFKMPQGGSISLEMVPILYMAFSRGVYPGLLSGLIAGVLDLVTATSEIVHPMQAILDYILASTALGLAPWFSFGRGWWRNLTGAIGGTLVGLMCHVLSGHIFFGQYAPAGTPAWLYSLTYNATYYLPKMIITIVVVVILMQKGVLRPENGGRGNGNRSQG
ncbi:MAG: energy-coupled thiamine transporter ThiT [Bacillota bacterium]|jgi:thiamine transporter|nr:energy-coupled thiamine transporter ThiT [Bacillota bacterium]HOB42715.1 energy-coupled thiamine transporter ThiT [Bacillota bacterium]HOO31345.1 energy-coupled thiamine transporter ThiT [Bacillota bacterium]HPZ14613.1 energy-coupled thiamine transporter ThiT [Bacillota bacterium]HQD79679.1 energy-coupled thiamine transporter ThiT [Bacillota bacterium]